MLLRANAGLVFRNGDVADLREKIQFLYDHPERREEFAARGRAFAMSQGNLEHDMDRLTSLVREAVIGRKK